MIYYFRTFIYKDDYRPTVSAIWYGVTPDCWDIRYDTEDNILETDSYYINYD